MQTLNLSIEKTKKGKPAAELRIFPNSAKEILTVVLPDHLTTGQLELYDMQGRQILQSTLVGQRSEVRLPGVQGVYIVMVYSPDNKVLVRQLLVIQ
ncbi:T9SS type A sorting domain-containing protein [Phaeodactylibacter sp.]|uniref:T9SS type A sorting domain-containing protein n=1 Tax=Phaeodactylibacter sp. TaxID=1940289 RepID=UPI0025D156C4|nr:T9SS type A sorting domain-containing protein [Phaeodactylibacter sp.]MCI4649052.1 T9SS type A sorting domain-containing protein [Phaeodactylibacter sp.]MCI5091770.1 T9SS type A sorting domain-containing protein [Phaeodactylibacter sp.]